MSHLSPNTFLLWAVLSVALCGFYFQHLWKFDRFRCLRPMRSRDGRFKRVMTYSYLIAMPVLLTYTIGFTAIKYQEGWIVLSDDRVIPKPFQMWTKVHQMAYFPLNMMWSLSWCSEATTHLEELCFWLYLIHSGPSPKPWFKSTYFRMWAIGTVASILSILVVTIETKSDPLKNEASLQLVGSLISTLTTLGFLPVLWVFPAFIQSVKDEGAEKEAIIRLVKFHDLNIIRIVFRFLFALPILMLSLDGLTPHSHDLNKNEFSTDLLSAISGVSCVVQAAMTLMIFFPRDVDRETKRWLKDMPSKPRSIKLMPALKFKRSNTVVTPDANPRDRSKFVLTDSPVESMAELPAIHYQKTHDPFSDTPRATTPFSFPNRPSSPPMVPPRLPVIDVDTPPYPFTPQTYPPQRDDSYSTQFSDNTLFNGLGLEGMQKTLTGPGTPLTESNMRMYAQSVSQINPMALYFTSPIQIDDLPAQPRRLFVLP